MNDFKLILIVKTTEKETQSIKDKDNLDTAIIDMNKEFGGMVKLDATIGAYAVIINNDTGKREDGLQWGDFVKDRVYTHNNVDTDNLAAYDTEKLAIGNYHTKLASQREKEGVTNALTIRIDGKGDFANVDVYPKVTPIEE